MFCLAKVPIPPPVPRNNNDSRVKRYILTDVADVFYVAVNEELSDIKDDFEDYQQ